MANAKEFLGQNDGSFRVAARVRITSSTCLRYGPPTCNFCQCLPSVSHLSVCNLVSTE
jgi:hypothetical protein